MWIETGSGNTSKIINSKDNVAEDSSKLVTIKRLSKKDQRDGGNHQLTEATSKQC